MTLELISLETLQTLVTEYGYWSVFIGIGLENMGIPLPGEALTLLGGFFAGSGELQYRWVLCGAIAGSFIGNNIGYLVGKWGGLPLLQKVAHFFKISDEKLAETKQKFLENAPKAVFIGRFITFFSDFCRSLRRHCGDGLADLSVVQFSGGDRLGNSDGDTPLFPRTHHAPGGCVAVHGEIRSPCFCLRRSLDYCSPVVGVSPPQPTRKISRDKQVFAFTPASRNLTRLTSRKIAR